MEQNADGSITIKWMTGVAEIKPVEHVATWKSHELFDVQSEIMRMTDCDDFVLSLFHQHGTPIRFTNERPARKNWLQRLLAQ